MNNERHPVRELTDMLADFIIRVEQLEKELDKALKSSKDWYSSWVKSEAQRKETEAKLAEEEKAHKITAELLWKMEEKIQGKKLKGISMPETQKHATERQGRPEGESIPPKA